MKTKILTIILFTLFSFAGFTQQISNGDFENWTVNTIYEEPDGFGTTNLQSYFTFGTSNVSKTNDSQSGIWAAHLVTVGGNPSSIPGGIFIGTPGPGGVSGGTPYTDKPLALQGYYKYNIMPNDTAMIMVFLKRNGNIMAVSAVNPTGVQGNYIQFTSPFFWIDTISSHFPDSLVAVIASSNFNNSVAGSELFLDNLTFFGATQPFPNGGFENWTPLSFEEPDNWFTLNMFGLFNGSVSVTKTTDHYATGTYALKCETIAIPNGSGDADTMGFVTNGRLGNNGPEGGMKINNNPKKVSGYYKYIPVGLDTALAGLFLYSNNVMIDTALTILAPTNTYTYFEINLNYSGPLTPDTLNIIFSSSNTIDSTSYVGVGSALYIDQLQIEYFPTNIREDLPEEFEFSIYPNPAKDKIFIRNDSKSFEYDIVITDVKGSIVRSFKMEYNEPINVSEFENGVYFYKIITENKTETGKIIICK